MNNARIALLAALLLTMAGCHGMGATGSSPYATPSEVRRNPIAAHELTQRATKLIDKDPEQAERLLREALGHDLWHPTSHNALGVLHLKQGRYYEAAHEFEWASKLMPGHPDPRMNLALTLERAGRFDEALATYDTALEVYPNHLPTMQALARLQLRRNRVDDRTGEFLKEIALRGQTPQWRDWARQRLTTLPSAP